MITLDRSEFLIMCVKKGVSLEQASASIVSMNHNLWTCDESHHAFPSTINNLSDNNQIFMLMGSIDGVNAFQSNFIANQKRET